MRLLLPTQAELSPDDLFDLYDEPGPVLRAGFVTSVDGAIAVDGTSSGLGSAADKAAFRALRTVADAVIVGAGTARKEGYGPVLHDGSAASWRALRSRAASTPLVVVSRSGDIPADSRFLQGPVLFAVPEGIDVPGEVLSTPDPATMIRALHARGLTRLLCEGGPALLTTLFAAGAVDELCLTTSPKAVGEGPHLLGAVPTRDVALLSLVHQDPGVLLARWRVVRSTND